MLEEVEPPDPAVWTEGAQAQEQVRALTPQVSTVLSMAQAPHPNLLPLAHPQQVLSEVLESTGAPSTAMMTHHTSSGFQEGLSWQIYLLT